MQRRWAYNLSRNAYYCKIKLNIISGRASDYLLLRHIQGSKWLKILEDFYGDLQSTFFI